MVAINYAKDIRVGEQPAKAVALGGNFVWPPLPERLFFRGQSLVYDFIKQRYGMRRHGHFTLVAGDSINGAGYVSEELAAAAGNPELAAGSISDQPVSGFNLLGLEFTDAGSMTQLGVYFQGDVEESLADIRIWIDGVEVEGPPYAFLYDVNLDVTVVTYNNPNMDPWVDGGQHIIAITLDGQELPDHPFEPPHSAIATLVAGDTSTDIGYVSEEYAASQGFPELAVGSISNQPVSGFNLLALVFIDTGSMTQLSVYFQGDVEESLAGIRIWIDGVEVEGPPLTIVYDANVNSTIVAYVNPNMTPWVVGGQYTIAITLDGPELPSEYYYTTNVNDLGILTRASTASYWGPSGSLLEAAVDEARIQHDPVTGEPLGLLVESGATNRFPHNNNIYINWPYNYVEVVGDSAVPEAFEIFCPGVDETPAGPVNGDTYWGGSSPSGGVYHRFMIKQGNAKEIRLLSANTTFLDWTPFEDLENIASSSLQIERIRDWFIITRLVPYQPGSSSQGRYGLRLAVRDKVDEEKDLSLIMANYQAEREDEGDPRPSTYIPTSGSPVTRAADDAVIDLSDVLNPDEGTYVVRAVVKDDGEMEFYAGYFDVFDIQTRISFYRRASGQFDLRLAGSGNSFIQAPPGMESGDTVTMAISYSIDTPVIFAVGGSTSSPGSVEYAPNTTINLIRGVGRNASDNNASLESSGIIAGFEYYPRALTEEELARITAFTPGDNS